MPFTSSLIITDLREQDNHAVWRKGSESKSSGASHCAERVGRPTGYEPTHYEWHRHEAAGQ
eukprot:12157971-Alexandrium_andersonii.AAC.1